MSEPRVASGVLEILFAYDIGLSLDIERARAAIGVPAETVHLHHRHRAPVYFQFAPPPLRTVQESLRIAVGAHQTSPAVEVSLFVFGGLSISYEIPLGGESLADLVELSSAATDCAELRADSRARALRVIQALGGAVTKPALAPIVEDYLIFQIRAMEPKDATGPELVGKHGARLAQILRAERSPLSQQEVADSLARAASYGSDDVTLVDWNGSLIIDTDPADSSAVVEFANVQLMEMRFLDSQLDESLDQSYELLSKDRRSWRVGGLRASLARVGRLQVDSAILFERVHNTLKLLGDPYLARIYRLAADRFKFQDWNAAILRKIDTIENIYEQLHDRVATQRMEVLEWIIIILITISIVLPFLLRIPH